MNRAAEATGFLDIAAPRALLQVAVGPNQVTE